jgi:hypothetical protein
MGQLYASLKTGHVTASVALKRLVGFSAKNRFYRANRDLGRILATPQPYPELEGLANEERQRQVVEADRHSGMLRAEALFGDG